jgi:hypothetical protein
MHFLLRGLGAVLLLLALLTGIVCFAKEEPQAPKPPQLEPSINAEDRAHWAFRPPIQGNIPSCPDGSSMGNPIDAFILNALTRLGLEPAPPAGRAMLLRRVTFDLIGLPPTPQELDDFVKDPHPDAYERVVDRLVASPHYGERWAQHWLDVARFAESNGYELDAERPHAWRYRDYIIRSFNDDKPYDRFVTEQLAGDELAGRSDPRSATDPLIATGFNLCGPIHLVSGNTDAEVNRQEVLTEMVHGAGAAFLGLTIGCARCHDHKFDPISQADYYRFQSFFAAAQPKDIDVAQDGERAAYDKRAKEVNAQIAALQKQVNNLEAPYRARLTEAKKARLEVPYRQALATPEGKRTPEERKLAEQAHLLIKLTWDELLDAMSNVDREKRSSWRSQIHALEATMPLPPARVWAIGNESSIPRTYVLTRGDPKRKGMEVEPAFPRVLVDPNAASGKASGASRLDRRAWLPRPTISANAANDRPTRSCLIGWPGSSSTTAGPSSISIDYWSFPALTGKQAGRRHPHWP